MPRKPRLSRQTKNECFWRLYKLGVRPATMNSKNFQKYFYKERCLLVVWETPHSREFALIQPEVFSIERLHIQISSLDE